MWLFNLIKKVVGLKNYERLTEPLRNPRGWVLYQYVQTFPHYIIRESAQKPKVDNIIISLTTYGQRKEQVKWTILSILNGSILPEQIHLYVENKLLPYFLEKEYILKDIIESGILVIHGVDEDLKSYKKLYYSLKDFPDKYILTIDDDIVYFNNWFKKLYSAHQNAPEYVWAYRVHKITYRQDSTIKPYLEWDWEYTLADPLCKTLFPTSGSGILFPPHIFSDIIFDKKIFLADCPTADDIWWWFCLRLNHAKIRGLQEDGKPFRKPYYEFACKQDGLYIKNVEFGANDIQIQALLARGHLFAL